MENTGIRLTPLGHSHPPVHVIALGKGQYMAVKDGEDTFGFSTTSAGKIAEAVNGLAQKVGLIRISSIDPQEKRVSGFKTGEKKEGKPFPVAPGEQEEALQALLDAVAQAASARLHPWQ